jgi:hypothetical protein
MKKVILIFILLLSTVYITAQNVATESFTTPTVPNTHKISQVTAPPSNDDCASSTSLTIGATLTCNQTTSGAGIQAGECRYPAGVCQNKQFGIE